MGRVLNFAILKHPVNWLTVFLMVALGMIALNLILTPWHTQSPDSVELNANSVPGPYLATSQ